METRTEIGSESVSSSSSSVEVSERSLRSLSHPSMDMSLVEGGSSSPGSHSVLVEGVSLFGEGG